MGMSPHSRPGDNSPLDPRRSGRRARTAPLPPAEDPARSVPEADRMTTLRHELGNLLDGSMRCLGMAARSLPAESAAASGAQVEMARKQIATVQQSLERMAEMLHHAMRGHAGVLGFAGRSITLGEALAHACDVTRPLAIEHRASVLCEVSPEAESLPAGPVYPVLLNAVRNAGEALAGCEGGAIEARAWVEGHDVIVRVSDDGPGPSGKAASDRVFFKHGFTTKSCGSGIGLSVAQAVASELGGRVSLGRGEGPRRGRPGAVFELRYPVASVLAEDGPSFGKDEEGSEDAA
ncbi:MAG: sensor histidine kinase [Phycisphaerales bacterium]|nr:MAG: sensor histidine kinase [Phycisphaerales bacterium]